MGTEGSGASRAGGDGIHNEDAFLVEDGLGLYIVCDGASDTPAGEVAASLASEAVEEFVQRAGEGLDLTREKVGRSVVSRAMSYALSEVSAAAERRPELGGLSTTVTMLLAHHDFGIIGHRGDSRAYLVRRGLTHQLTLDHELTQATPDDSPDPEGFDVFSIDLKPGDTIILCTDGAERVLDEGVIAATRSLSPRVLASRIVGAARKRNPHVDATAVVVRVREDAQPGWLELSRPVLDTVFGHRVAYA